MTLNGWFYPQPADILITFIVTNTNKTTPLWCKKGQVCAILNGLLRALNTEISKRFFPVWIYILICTLKVTNNSRNKKQQHSCVFCFNVMGIIYFSRLGSLYVLKYMYENVCWKYQCICAMALYLLLIGVEMRVESLHFLI